MPQFKNSSAHQAFLTIDKSVYAKPSGGTNRMKEIVETR